MGDLSHEPSMEEILSSIKRIIAEDSDAAMSAPRGKRSVGRAGALDAPEQQTDAPPEPEVLELTDPVATEEPEVEMPAPEPVAADAPPAESKPALVSAAAVEATRLSLAALSSLVVKPDVAGSDTLEGMVRDMLRPMLSEWLEANLPEIVERIVAREISRITDRGL